MIGLANPLAVESFSSWLDFDGINDSDDLFWLGWHEDFILQLRFGHTNDYLGCKATLSQGMHDKS